MPSTKSRLEDLYRPRLHHHVEWMAYWIVSRCRLHLRRIEGRYQ